MQFKGEALAGGGPARPNRGPARDVLARIKQLERFPYERVATFWEWEILGAVICRERGLLPPMAGAASYFAVGLPFTFDGTTNHFATTSGGGASVANPTSSDTVTFDGNSGTGTCTFTANMTCSTFASSSANVTISPGSHSITASGTGTAWNWTAGTFTAGTSTITLSGAGVTFAGGAKSYATLSLTGSGTATVGGANTFVNLTRTGTAVKTDVLSLSASQTITGTLTLSGSSTQGNNRLLAQSSTLGTARTLTMTGGAVVIGGDVDFTDITISGAPSWANAGSAFVGDGGGNSGLTTTTPAAQTWSGNTTANYSTTADWTSRVPLPQDNVAINGLTSGTITVDMPRIGANIDLTGSSGGSFSWNTSITSFGNVTMASGVTASGGSNFWSFQGRGAQTITNNSVTWSASTVRLSIDAGGTYTMQDAMTMVTNATPSLLRLQLGTLDLGTSFSHTLGNITVSGGTLNGHSCTLTLNATGVANVVNISGGTINTSSTNFVVATSTTGTRTFIGLAKAYGNLTINGTAGASAVAVTSANTFATITVQADGHLTLPSSTVTTCTGFASGGSSGHLAVLDSSSSGTAATLSCANLVNCDFLSVKDSTASGNTPFYAGQNGTLVSGTTNWNQTSVMTLTPSAAAASAATDNVTVAQSLSPSAAGASASTATATASAQLSPSAVTATQAFAAVGHGWPYLEPYPWTGTWSNNPFLTNVFKTTLAAPVNTAPVAGTVETWTVVDTPPAFHAATGTAKPHLPFYAAIDGGGSPNRETIQVTDVQSNPTYTTWTVVRGASGSTPATHASGAPVLTSLSLAAGFMGGDGNPSVDLGGGRVLWMSLDVIWATGSGETRSGFPASHSLFGIQQGYDLSTCTFTWYPVFHNTTTLTEFFPDCAALDGSGMPIYFSGLSGIMIDGTLVIFGVASSNQGPENYVANVAFYVDNPSATPDLWHWRMMPMYAEVPTGAQVGSCAILDPGDGYIYTWGGVGKPAFIGGAIFFGMRFLRTDVKAGQLMNPQHWCGKKWGWTFEDVGRSIIRQPMIGFEPFVNQAWQWKRPAGDYMLTVCTPSKVQYALRADLNDAWPTVTDLWTISSILGAAIDYAPYMHPEQTWSGKGANEVMITYTAGFPTGGIDVQPECYYPKLVRLVNI